MDQRINIAAHNIYPEMNLVARNLVKRHRVIDNFSSKLKFKIYQANVTDFQETVNLTKKQDVKISAGLISAIHRER